MNNIYTKQMQKLGLNPKQYAELIDIPYEVVKDFIYDKEGDYKMGLKELLRKNMLQKHQEVEENYENAKFKAMEIKHNNKEINYLEWYDKGYSVSLLKSALKINSISDFKKRYDLMFNGNRFSNWTYQVLLGKREYEGHEIAPQKKEEFLKQLYDIIVNGNSNNYLRIKPLSSRDVSSTHNSEKAKILKWYKKFNFKKYLEDNNITQSDLSRLIGIPTGVISKMINGKKTNYVTTNLITLYNYVVNNSTNKENKSDYDEKEVINWFNNFDFNNFRRKYQMSNEIIADDCGLSHSTISKMSQGTYNSFPAIIKFYDYVKKLESKEPVEYVNDAEIVEDDNDDLFEDLKEEIEENDVVSNDLASEKVDDYTPQMVSNNDNNNTNNDILRKLLSNRLTEEERELIKIFGGVID